MNDTSIEARLNQIERRQALADEYNSWLLESTRSRGAITAIEQGEKWAELRAKHGVVPIAPGTPTVQPATERTRWFRDWVGQVMEFPSKRYWGPEGKIRGLTVLTMEKCIEKQCVELDGPPPHGKPLVQPAAKGEGDGMEKRAKTYCNHVRNTNGTGRFAITASDTHEQVAAFARAEVARATAELEGQLGNLLAVIHRDGGHYISRYGLKKAVTDAMDVCSRHNADDPREQVATLTKERDAALADRAEFLRRKRVAQGVTRKMADKLKPTRTPAMLEISPTTGKVVKRKGKRKAAKKGKR